jgi:hypothetical protein
MRAMVFATSPTCCPVAGVGSSERLRLGHEASGMLEWCCDVLKASVSMDRSADVCDRNVSREQSSATMAAAGSCVPGTQGRYFVVLRPKDGKLGLVCMTLKSSFWSLDRRRRSGGLSGGRKTGRRG